MLDPHQATVALRALQARRDAPAPVRLTPREQAILASIGQGESVKQTARHLGITAKTVENLQSRLFRKLGVRNRAQAVAAAHRGRLLPPDAAAPQDPAWQPDRSA